MLDVLTSGGDLHSEVARACWPNILGNLTDKEIVEKCKDLYNKIEYIGKEFGKYAKDLKD